MSDEQQLPSDAPAVVPGTDEVTPPPAEQINNGQPTLEEQQEQAAQEEQEAQEEAEQSDKGSDEASE